MRKIFFIPFFLCLLKADFALGYQSSTLFLKQANEYYTLAQKETKAGNLGEAIKYLQKTVAINPYFAEAHFELGKLYLVKGWPERAEESFRAAMNINPRLIPPQTYKKLRDEKTDERTGRGEERILSEAEVWAEEIVAERKAGIERESSLESMPRRYQEILVREPGAIGAKYIGTSEIESYPAEKKGPTVTSILDPYHPEHEGFKVPYYKDREGLKITPIVGIRGEYMVDRQLAGIESLIQEAQEFDQRTDEQARRYISINDKEYHREEIVLHYKETWPKFTYTYLEERARREYDAKTLWSTNNVFYDNYNRKSYQIEHTIPGVKKLGALKFTLRYVDSLGFKPNDPAAYLSGDSYLIGIETLPYSEFLKGTFGVKFAYQYSEGEYKRAAEQGWTERENKENQYWLEMDFYYPEKYLRIKPHFYYEKERHYPSYNTWYVRKNGVKIEKDLNGKIKFVTDWTYIDYAREKDPYLAGAKRLSASAWKWENDLEYEFIRDWKLKLGCDYGNALGFSLFDYYTLRSELQFKKPGFGEFRLGYGHTNYFELDDSVDTFLFKFGLFI